MKTIILKSLKLKYFKGAINLEVNFNPEITEISGANRTGKSTLFDAWSFLLFGKDSQGKTDFEIKTLNPDNSVIPQVDHEVTGVIIVDDREIELKKVYRENRVKRRGEEKTVMSGHETICTFDTFPKQIGEYNKLIAEILDESTFKLITNPLYFNSLNWDKRREVLIRMANDITDEYIVSLNPSFKTLISQLNGYTVADLKKKTAIEKLLLKKQLDEIPTRVDEVVKQKPIPLDWAGIAGSIADRQNQIGEIDEAIQDKTKASQSQFAEIQAKQKQVNDLRSKQNQIVFTAKETAQNEAFKANEAYREKNNKIQNLSNDWRQLDNELKTLKIDLLNTQRNYEQCEVKRTELREKFNLVNESVFKSDSTELLCPLYNHVCDSNFAIGQFRNSTETAIKNFNAGKRAKLESIRNDGLGQKQKLESLEQSITVIQGEISKTEAKLQETEKAIKELREVVAGLSIQEPAIIVPENIKEWVELAYQIQAIEKELTEFKPVDNSELTEKRKALVTELDELKKQFATREQIEKADNRIIELNAEARDLSQKMADLEKIEYNLMQFSKAKMTEIDKVINSKFSYVKFKLFDTLVNGAEIECCITLIDGVPFESANHASQINAGVDICNSFANFYNVSAPIWIDNREALNELIKCNSQIINLWVSNDPYLVIK